MKVTYLYTLTVALTLGTSAVWAFQPPTRPTLPNYDQREAAAQTGAASPEQQAAVSELRARLPRARVDFDHITGSPAMVSAIDDTLTGPGGQGKAVSANAAAGMPAGDPYGPTKVFLGEHRNLFGHGPEALDSARITREFVSGHNGLRTVVWEQQVDGIPVFEGVLVSHTTKAGELVNVSSRFVPAPGAAAERGTPGRSALVASPTIGAAEAVARAALNVGEEAQTEQVTAAGEAATGVEKRQKFKAAFLRGESEAKLAWLPLDAQNLRLCWDVLLTSRQRAEMFRVLVDAQTGTVLVRRCLTEYISDATYNVFTSDSPSPFSPGYSTPVSTQPPLVSRTLVTLSALDTTASPNGWIDDGVNQTVGNNVDAHTDRNDDDQPDLPRPQGSPFRVFDFPMDLTTQDPTNYSQAAVVQLFYLCNWMHDKLYELGFNEAAGNFQSNNFGRGGLGSDALQADAQDGGGYDNANFSTPPDGYAPRMQMYIFSGPRPRRDGDLDAEVVLHEYTHGLSNRRVGGGVGISALQSGGMGEGWSDFYALTLLSAAGDDVNGCYGAGAYASYQLGGLSQNYYFGIRRYPYSTDLTKNPLTFKDIDPAQASAHTGIPRSPIAGGGANEVHNMGEVWCVTLWEARAKLITKYGYDVGNQLILQLVTDGMNLSPANPNFVQARDAILQADLVDNGGANRNDLWAAFAKRGLGTKATSPSSSTTSGVVEAFDVPDDFVITPALVFASGPVGGPFSPSPVSFVLTNTGSNTLSWSLANTSAWLTVSPASGTLTLSNRTATVNVSVGAGANSFPLGGYTAGIVFTNRTSGFVQSRSFALYVVGKNLFDDFDPGINLSMWSSFGGVVGGSVLATNYGGCVSPPNSLWFGDSGSRFATTIPVNTSSGGTISFNLHLANGGAWPWEQVNLPSQGIVLEYSLDSGTTWATAGTYNTSDYYNWTAVTLPIPAGAQGPAVEFRWRQLSNSGSGFNHWALDNVSIDAGPLAPTIYSQPQSQAAVVGDSVNLSITAAGTQPLAYQWRLNGTNLSGATGSSLVFTNVQFTDAGTYCVFLSNSIGTALSSNAVLTVLPMPPCVTPPAGLVSWWRAEGNALDQAGNNNGTLVGNTTYGPGRVGQGFVFDGDGDFVNVGNAANLQMQDFTIEAWVKRASTSIVSYGSGGNAVIFGYGRGGYGLVLVPGGYPALSAIGVDNTQVPVAIADTKFHHLAVTKSGSAVVFYIDGVGYTAPTYSSVFTFSTVAAIGARGDNQDNSFLGTIDEAAVYNRALTAAEVQAIYNAGGSGKCLAATSPSIASQPMDQTVMAGATATFTVQANGTPPLFYQWRFNGSPLAQATNSALALVAVTTNLAGMYSVVVSNAYGSTNSTSAVLTVLTLTNLFAPSISAQPTNQTVMVGGAAAFAVGANGTPPLFYQWRFNGSPVAQATNSLLTLTAVTTNLAGMYSVVVSNAYGSILSSNAALSVYSGGPCVIPPSGLISWWRAEGNALDQAGTNNGTLQGNTIYSPGRFGLGFAFDGSGDAVNVGNPASLQMQDFTIEAWIKRASTSVVSYGSSGNAVIFGYGSGGYGLILVPNGVPVLSKIDSGGSQIAVAITDTNFHHLASTKSGSSVTIYIDGTAYPAPAYDPGFWFSTPAAIGARGDNLDNSFLGTIDEVSVYNRALSAAEIQAIYNASQGKCTTPVPASILSQPADQTVTVGSNATFSVAATGSLPLFYQWRFNGGNLPGQTNTTLTLPGVTTNQAGQYSAMVTNAFGSAISSNATLTVYVPPPPTITHQPESRVLAAGTYGSFAVTAVGDAPLVYQWFFRGTTVPNATNSVLELTDVQAANQGDYLVVVTNLGGSVTSDVVTLSVTPALPAITQQPVSRAFFPGFGAAFSAAAAGTEPFSYQWQFNGADIGGATNAVLGLSNVALESAGTYRVLVTNSIGTTASADVLLVPVPVAAWGYDASGQTELLLQLTNAVQVSAGAAHSLALCRDGTVVAWGAADQTNVPPGLSGVAAIAAGGDHSLALITNGTVIAWGGNNSAGQTNVPVNLTNAVAVAAGASHSLALKADGGVVAWGLNSYGQATAPLGLTNVIAIAAGSNFSLALQGNGKVVGWGDNTYRQTTSATNFSDVVAIAAGAAHALALKSDGTVVAWGANTYGQTNVPAGLSHVAAIGAGAFHSLALKTDGTMVAWGAGSGTNTSTYPNVGQSVIPATVTNVTAIAGGGAHTVALVGHGAPFISEAPASRSIYSGRRTVFRASATGALPLRYQWQLNGTNISGATSPLLVIDNAFANWAGNYRVVVSNALGTATSTEAALRLVDSPPFVISQPVSQPAYLGGQALWQVAADGSGPFFYQWRLNGVDIAGATNAALLLNRVLLNQAGNYSVVVSNAFGVVSSAKATLTVSQVVAWGAVGANYGQTNVPANLANVSSVAGGAYHTLALKTDGRVAAWGAGTNYGSSPSYGQSIVPASLTNAVAVAAGAYHSLALRADGTVAAWGAGTNYTSSPNYSQSVVPTGLGNVVAIAAGDYHSVALKADGKVAAWGYNLYAQTNVPAAATNVVAIAARGNHTLALKADGSLVHWGSLASLPTGASNFVAIAAGVNHCLALQTNGTVVSWGSQTTVPAGLSNVVDIAAGYDFSLALKSDGSVVTWGATNGYGLGTIPAGLAYAIDIGCGAYHSVVALGDGSALIKSQPASVTAYLGSPATFRVLAVGAGSLGYQWQANGSNLPGATNAWVTLASVQASDAGIYQVVVSNPYGSVTSSPASLAVLLTLAQTLDAPGLTWAASGNAAWFGQTNITHDGLDAAQSGLITDSQQSTLQTTVSGAGTLSFWWKVSSEQFFDYLSFYVDGIYQAGISGEVDWQPQTFAIANGTHTLQWVYAKDFSVSVGADAAWLDQVSFVTNPPVITLQPLGQTAGMGATVTLNVAATGASPLGYQWFQDGVSLGGATAATLTVTHATRHNSGAYSVTVSNPGGNSLSSNAVLRVRVPQNLGAPTRTADGSFVLTSGDADGGLLLPGDLANFEVQASTNLIHWFSVTNSLTLTNGTLRLVDPMSQTARARFYRILEH